MSDAAGAHQPLAESLAAKRQTGAVWRYALILSSDAGGNCRRMRQRAGATAANTRQAADAIRKFHNPTTACVVRERALARGISSRRCVVCEEGSSCRGDMMSGKKRSTIAL